MPSSFVLFYYKLTMQTKNQNDFMAMPPDLKKNKLFTDERRTTNIHIRSESDEKTLRVYESFRVLYYFCSNRKQIYFTGAFFKTSTRKSQNFCTEGMLTRSSGEWGERIVGPKEIMSQLG